MATDVSVDDFTSESSDGSGAPPLVDTPPAETATTGDAPPAEIATEDEDETPPAAAAAEPEAKPKDGERNPDGTFKAKEGWKRIQQLTAERKQAVEEAQAARAEAEDLRRRMSTPEPPKRQEEPSQFRGVADPTDPEPNPEDATKYPEGQYDRQFLKDQARWEARQEFRAQSQIAAQRAYAVQRQQHQAQRVNGYRERMDAAVTADPEFINRLHPQVAALQPTSELPQGQTPTPLSDLAEELLDSPHAAQLLRHFSDTPDELRRFASLPTRRALLHEFTKLEMRFDPGLPGSGPKTPSLSQAKPPIRPVGSAPSASDESPGEESSFDEYVRYWNAKDKIPPPRRRR